MKVTIEFNLPEQQEEYESFMNGAKWKHVVREIDEHMRRAIKYNDGKVTSTHLFTTQEVKDIHTLQEVRDMLLEYMEQENLRLHE